MTLRCWLFGHTYGKWVKWDNEYVPDHARETYSAKCTRCGYQTDQHAVSVVEEEPEE